MSEVQCPRCAKPAPGLQSIDAGLLAKLTEAGNVGLPNQVCGNCFAQLAGSVARGSILIQREKKQEQHKLMLWKSRVALVKRARALMQEKSFSDAAVSYEKYIRVLEVVFDAKPGMLGPDHFKDSARTQELTVVSAAYWDLIRIYDTSEKYGDRMRDATIKLGTFLRFTPIYPDIMRKAEAFSKKCKNKAVMKNFVKSTGESRGGCFIASSAFDSAVAPEVLTLRRWRDEKLVPSQAGRIFIHCYYRISPPLARFLNKHPTLKPSVRAILRKFIDLAVRH